MMFSIALVLFASGQLTPQQARVSPSPPTKACSSTRAQLVRDGSELRIDGFLDEGVRRCFRELYDRNVERLIVRSSGGFPEPSLEIAEQLAERRPQITIRDFCGSACASFLLPTASRISADGPVLVLFHHTNTSASESLRTAPEALLRRYRKLSTRELKLYATLGVSPWLLRIPFSAEKPVCQLIVQDRVAGVSSDYVSKYQATIIDRKLLRAAGLNVPDAVADDESSFMEAAKRVLPDAGKMLLSKGIASLRADPEMTPSRLRTQGEQRLLPLPMCH